MIALEAPLERPLEVTPHGHFGDPRPKRNGVHMGVDFRADHGDAVVSATRGTVVRVGYDKPVSQGGGGGGNYVIVGAMAPPPDSPSDADALKPYELGYMHLSEILVARGANVEPGQLVGNAGSSGAAASGTHLHFQVRYLGDALPRYLNPEKLGLPIGAPSSSSSASSSSSGGWWVAAAIAAAAAWWMRP